MLILHRTVPDARQVEVCVNDDGATVAELATALGENLPLVVDGRPWSGEVALAATGLRDGSEIGAACSSMAADAVAGLAAIAALPCAVSAIHVVGGLDAGGVVPLGPGTVTVGRDDGADVRLESGTVSVAHAELRVSDAPRVEVRDLGSRNGTWVAGQLASSWSTVPDGDRARLGGVHVRFGRSGDEDRHPAASPGRAQASGLVHHRPPRSPLPGPPEAVELPRPPVEGPARPTWPWRAQ
ncbi:MAG: FHA domain-containing protein, partial [Acidimicrobiia bacterium]|nr:FHA domain-containing protein [Acidimicrobiia bacterium]